MCIRDRVSTQSTGGFEEQMDGNAPSLALPRPCGPRGTMERAQAVSDGDVWRERLGRLRVNTTDSVPIRPKPQGPLVVSHITVKQRFFPTKEDKVPQIIVRHHHTRQRRVSGSKFQSPTTPSPQSSSPSLPLTHSQQRPRTSWCGWSS
eukprot:TRINITY_DN2709_c0_g1_i6.p1 TRINITY_DN2709_c0_g1~~TRINITY_DN2709_c0_g1_i6.p1  ORF type:complete len:148 (+),score=18.60 TRINITY_DN2709_c0_g1_i6:168-611(+)